MAQGLGATAIVQGGNVANVTANNALQVELHVGATQITATGSSLNVNLTNGGSGGTAVADEATFTPGTTSYTPAGCFFQTTSTNNALTNLQGGWFQCTARRGLFANIDTIAGNTVTTAASGTQMVGIEGGSGVRVDAATGAAPPANAIFTAGIGSGATGGFLIGAPIADSFKDINIATGTTTLLITGVAGRQVRIASFELSTAGADNIEWIEGTGATCGTGTAGMVGGTTTGTGYVFLANGVITRGSGIGTVLSTATSGDSVCMVTSAAVQVAGHIAYTIF